MSTTIHQRIRAAAEQLQSKTGEIPTNQQVRDKLGTSSMSTISKVMKQWRQEQNQPQITQVVSEDWETLRQENQALKRALESAQAQILELEEILEAVSERADLFDDLRNQLVIWQQKHDRLESQLLEVVKSQLSKESVL